jgi:hypothetical protein
MKIIKYNFLSCRINHGTEEPNYEDVILPKEIHCTADNLEANEAIAQKEAYNGEYTIEDDGVEETATPTQLDVIEAQVAYTAMMTDTLLEV